MQVAFEANSHNIALYIYYEGKFREKLVFGNTSVRMLLTEKDFLQNSAVEFIF